MNLAYAQNKVGDFSGALKTYKKIYKHEQNGYYLSIIQRLQSKLGYYREAIQTNLKIIEINNNNRKTKDKVVEAFSNIGDLELKLYNYKDACNYWRKSRKVAKSILNNQLVKKISKENINKIRENCGDSKIVKVRKFFLW